MQKWILALAMLVAGSANAALISVTANSGWSCGTGDGGFEAGCTPDVEYGMVNFVYDTSVPDSNPNPSPEIGVYSGALVAFTMTVEQQTRPDLFFTLAPGPNTLRVGLYEGVTFLRLEFNATEQSGAFGESSDMQFGLNIYGGFYVDMPEMSLPGVSYWDSATAYVGGASGPGGGASETDWAWSFRAVEIPLPGTLALMGLGLLLAARGRKLQGLRETIDS